MSGQVIFDGAAPPADQRRGDDVLHAEQVGMAHGAPHDAPQDVTPVLVGGEDAVVDEHRARSRMLGDDPEPEAVAILVVAHEVLLPGQRLRLVDHRLHQVGFPDRVDVLQQRENPFEPGASVEHKWYCRDGAGLVLIEGVGGGRTEVETLTEVGP